MLLRNHSAYALVLCCSDLPKSNCTRVGSSKNVLMSTQTVVNNSIFRLQLKSKLNRCYILPDEIPLEITSNKSKKNYTPDSESVKTVKASCWLTHLELKSNAPKDKRSYLMKRNAELSWTPYCSIEILQLLWARSIYRLNCVYATATIESFFKSKHQCRI